MRAPSTRAGWVLCALAFLAFGCSRSSPDEDVGRQASVPGGAGHARQGPPGPLPGVVLPYDPPVRKPLGGPIDGLTPDELAAFNRGKVLFEHRFTPSEGLGALYNAVSCASCHSTPVTGGSSQLYRNFYVALRGTTSQTPLPGLPSLVVPAFGNGVDFSLQRGRTIIPDMVGLTPVVSAQRNAIPIFGVGLFEFINNVTIFLNSDPNDADGDGISGRYNNDAAGLGRFGTKAQSNNIELFTRAPLFNQMGITSNPFLGVNGTVSLAFCAPQGSGNPNDPINDTDGVPDPEISHADLGDLIAYTRFLAPPEKLRPFSAAARRGEDLFASMGCTDCHIPSLPSSRGPVEAYTDLLIHDMGPALADGINLGIPQSSSISGNTTGGEWRTQPLWGVSLSAPFLHDGRAETLQEAVEFHAGEAQASRDQFVALPASQQADVIEFLEHL